MNRTLQTGEQVTRPALVDDIPPREEFFFLGRQPIVDANRELCAYELLFRSGIRESADVTNDFVATATVIDHAFMSLGLNAAIGDRLGFINVSETVLMSDLIEALPHEHVVLEILETVPLTPTVIARCRQLKERGFRLALDDVIRLADEQIAVLDAVDFVKFDVQEMAPQTIQDMVGEVRRRGLKAIAEKVETERQFEQFRAIGFDLFQGYFFARPTIMTGRDVHPSKIMLINLMRLLAHDAEIDDIERALKEAPDLALRLLRYANSVTLRPLHKVTTLRNAVFRIGREQIGRIVQIMLFARFHDAAVSSDPLVQAAAIRGRLMESLAVAEGLADLRDEAFMVGILSLADAVFGQTMVDVVSMLDISENLQNALLHRSGPLGELLTLVEASEHVEDPELATIPSQLSGPEIMAFNRMQIEAMCWAQRL